MSTFKTVSLGGTASNVKIGSIGYGLMLMSATPEPTPDEQAFEAFKTAIDQVPEGYKLFINSGEFYGHNPRTANLDLVARFFTKYPELAERCFLSVKGGTGATDMIPDASPENLRRSVDTINKFLDGKKKMDLFECARVDPKVPIEEAIKTLKGFVDEGKFDHIGLSEVSAETLRRANKVHPVAAVEIEVSPWSYEEETKKVLATCEELDIAVIAYSPLGHGFLTDGFKVEDLPEGDFRRRLARFQKDAVASNQRLVDNFSNLAQRKGITTAQLCLAWVSSLGSHVVPLPGTSKAHRVVENQAAARIEFTAAESEEVNKAVEEFQKNTKGPRYFNEDGKVDHLWG